LSVSKLKRIVLPLPSLREQRRIVEILEGHLSRLDAAESAMGRVATRTAALAEQLVTAGITGDTAPGQRVEAAPPPAECHDGPLPSPPSGWRWCRLGEVADVVGGVTKDAKKQANPGYVEVPYLRVANVQRGRLDLETVTTIRVPPTKADSLRLLAGDVLLNEGGDRDKLARGWVWDGQIDNCIHQNHVFRARVRDGIVDPRFLSWTANTIGGRWAERNGKQSVNLASISLTMIRKMPVIVPPQGVSTAIAQHLEVSLMQLDRLRFETQGAIERSRRLRRAVLAAAFAGRLTGKCTDDEVIEDLASL
jgi:type I restriction enzyme S subunit